MAELPSVVGMTTKRVPEVQKCVLHCETLGLSVVGMLEMEADTTINNNFSAAFGQGSIVEVGKKVQGIVDSGVFGNSSNTGDTDYTTVSSLNTQQSYDGSEPPIVDLPLVFIAFENPRLEVENAIKALNEMSLPSLTKLPIGGRMPPEVTINLRRQIIVKGGRIETLTVQDFGAYSKEGTLWAKANVTIKAMQMMSRQNATNQAN